MQTDCNFTASLGRVKHTHHGQIDLNKMLGTVTGPVEQGGLPGLVPVIFETLVTLKIGIE